MKILYTAAFAILPGFAEGLQTYAQSKQDPLLEKTSRIICQARDTLHINIALTALGVLGIALLDENDHFSQDACRTIASIGTSIVSAAALTLYKATSNFFLQSHNDTRPSYAIELL